MKHRHKTTALIVILCFCINSVFAQTFKDVFNPETTITYLGIDFTNVKVIGHQEGEVMDLADRQFSGINQLVLDEPKKYDVAGEKHLTEADINGIVKGYDFGGKKGIGFLFIMESMSKKSEHGSMYLTFV